MLKDLLALLKEYPGLEYRIVEVNTEGEESYFVRKQLEMKRRVDMTRIYLTVYRVFTEEGNRYRGSYQTEIHPDSSREEMAKTIEEALDAASFVKNQWYPLAAPAPDPDDLIQSDFAGQDLHESVEKLKNALYAPDKHEQGYLSFAELNLRKKETRILNSQGVDVAYTGYGAEMETAVNWRVKDWQAEDCQVKEDKEIEIFETYKMANGDTRLLTENVERLFAVAAQKSLAAPTPELTNVNVLLTGECVSAFFSYYYTNACAESVYQNKSTFQIGEALQGDGDGDKITLTLEPGLAGSTSSRPWDSDGFPLQRVRIIERGKLLRYWGDLRFSYLLNVEPTGRIENFVVSGGSQRVEEMKKAPYLELVSFSDFKMNTITGDFAGEIRLGFYDDGETLRPVTGGSLSGNMKKVHGSMRMSVETRQYNHYAGPDTVCIRGAVISGCV